MHLLPYFRISRSYCRKHRRNWEVCFKFSTSSSLTEFLTSIKHLPDLLILDYTCYNHEFFNIQPTLKSINKLFPVIFYNDPCLIHPKRSLHWETQLKLLYNITEKEQLDKYKQVFEKIEAIVESPELKRYIPLMQTPLPFPKNESKTKTLFSKLQIDTSLSLLNFKKRCNLAENLYSATLNLEIDSVQENHFQIFAICSYVVLGAVGIAIIVFLVNSFVKARKINVK